MDSNYIKVIHQEILVDGKQQLLVSQSRDDYDILKYILYIIFVFDSYI